MKNKFKKNTYKSFDQWKAKSFPKMTEQESLNNQSKDTKKFAIRLANKSIEKVLSA